MEEKENLKNQEFKRNNCPECNNADSCRHYCWKHHVLSRFILGVLILLFVFWGGVKLGELKTFVYYQVERNYFPQQYHLRWWKDDDKNFAYPPCYYNRNYKNPTSTNE
jgi:hypothetical protein